MYITYTFYSRALCAEETVTILMPEPSRDDKARRILPALFVMGDEGTENNWWLRHSFAEGDVQKSPLAMVCVRGMKPGEAALRFVKDELPVLMCALFPLDHKAIHWFGWKRCAAIGQALAQDGPYQKIMCGCADVEGLRRMPAEDCAEALQQAIGQVLAAC